ncbi:hypothetical protein [Curtobacterium sp. 458]|uniref:hypothetical protein n=1 Tax=Curtobacterium sp. 458 TaxID=3050069 RepID=UPI0025B30560|nr:hypothetical protein [Curtobacterium sp. 458]WJY00377.1 hypothetical protein QPJ90_01480 [Curtobacterium sp. 458]
MQRTLIAIIAAGVFALCLTGCSSAFTSEGSRVQLYDSVPALAGDSSIVVAGTVSSQETVSDLSEGGVFTLSTFTVTKSAKTDSAHPDGSTITVRQIGSPKTSGPAPFLEQGKSYLLYLHPSELEGELATHFFVTGGSAGIYEMQQSDAARSAGGVTEDTEFTKAPSDEGDELPEVLTLDEALQG